MGVVLVLMVFLYLLALPVATLGALIFVTASAKLGALVVAGRAVVVVSSLMLVLTPGIVSNGAGSFLLPWWLHVAVGHSGVEYYPLQYMLFCTATLVVLLSLRAAWRAVAERLASARGKAS
jgi:hypothetical protein